MTPKSRGCPKCEEACNSGDAGGRCGTDGVCRNPIIGAADQFACTCKPGFQPSMKDAYSNALSMPAPTAACTQRELTVIYLISLSSCHN